MQVNGIEINPANSPRSTQRHMLTSLSKVRAGLASSNPASVDDALREFFDTYRRFCEKAAAYWDAALAEHPFRLGEQHRATFTDMRDYYRQKTERMKQTCE